MDADTTPAGTPPPGVIPDLVHPHDQYGITIACAAAAMACTLPVVVMKLFTKARILKQVQHEDLILILAEACFIGWLIMDLLDPDHNAHIWDTKQSAIPRIQYKGNMLEDFYSPTILFTKCAALLQLQRIFAVNPFNRIWWTSQSLLWSSTIFYTVIFFSCIFQCTPRRKIWFPDVPGTCLSMPGIMASSAIWNVLVNLGILLLPVIALRGSHLSKRKKTIVFSVFSISFLAMLASVARIVVTIQLADTDDQTFLLEAQAMWALAEIAFMIIAASVPTMPAFVKYCHARIRGVDPLQSAREAAGSPERDMLQRQRRGHTWRQIDEEIGMSETAATSTVILPPPLGPEEPLPPPIVPPKDGYNDVRREELESQGQRKNHDEKHPRAPPPSPVASRTTSGAMTWYHDQSDESGSENGGGEARKGSDAPMLERPQPALVVSFKHRSI